MSITVDGAPSLSLLPLAKKQLNSIKALGLPAKTARINGYTIWTYSVDAVDKIRISEPDRPMVSWGINDFPAGPGVLGSGDTAFRATPGPVLHRPTWIAVSAGRSHVLGINSDGSLWAWGDNSNGSLGLGDTVDRLKPANVTSPGAWSAVSAGHYFSLGLKVDGSLWGWGGNYVGDPPINSYTPIQIGTDRWSVISAALNDSFGVRADGTLWNLKMGLGTAVAAATPEQVDGGQWATVSASWGHRLAIKADGTLWAWGLADHPATHGALGLGDTTGRATPTEVGGTWLAAQAAGSHSLGIKTDGTLWAWGFNINGQLGLGDTADRLAPTQVGSDTWVVISGGNTHSLAIRTDNSLWQWGYGEIYEPEQVGDSASWRIISAGYEPFNLATYGWAGRPDSVLVGRIQGAV